MTFHVDQVRKFLEDFPDVSKDPDAALEEILAESVENIVSAGIVDRVLGHENSERLDLLINSHPEYRSIW